MGVYLNKPNKTKLSQDGEGSIVSYGLSAMQGWRLNMEDAHIAIPDININGFEHMGVFGVFDGHGGPAVSSWVSAKFASIFENQLTNILLSVDNNTFSAKYEEVNTNIAAVCEALQKTFLRLDVEMSFPENREIIRAIHRELEKRQSDESTDDGTEKTQQISFLDALLYGIHPEKTYVRLFKRDGKRFVDLGFEPGNSEDNEKLSDDANASLDSELHETEEDEMLLNTDYRLLPSREDEFENEISFGGSDQSRSESEESEKKDAKNHIDEVNNTDVPVSLQCKEIEEDLPCEKNKQQDCKLEDETSNEETITAAAEVEDATDKRSEPDEKGSYIDLQKTLKKTKNDGISEKDLMLDDTEDNQGLPVADVANPTAVEEEASKIANTALTSLGVPASQQQNSVSTMSNESNNQFETYDEKSSLPRINELPTNEPIDVTQIFDKCEHSVTKPDTCEEEKNSSSSVYEEDEDLDSGLKSKEKQEAISWSKFPKKFTVKSVSPAKQKQPEAAEEAPTTTESTPEADPDQPENCGTTAVVVVVLPATKTMPPYLIVANAGDSRAVLCRNGSAIALSKDHKPILVGEKRRVRLAGGEVVNGRIDGNLNLSRALGDLYYKNNPLINPEEQKIIALPDVRFVELQPEDEFVIIACDGIWDCLSNQKAVKFVKDSMMDQSSSLNNDAPKKLSEICERMCDSCLSANPISSEGGIGCDNMTVMIIHLNKNRPISSNFAVEPEEINMDSVLKFYGEYNPEDFEEFAPLTFDDSCF